LPTFILARRKNRADESGRPLTENRYSPFRPNGRLAFSAVPPKLHFTEFELYEPTFGSLTLSTIK